MLSDIVQWDISLFLAINKGLENRLFDAVLPWCREPLFWAPLYVFIISFALFNFKPGKYWVFLFGLVACVGLSDVTSSRLIKKNVHRLRPCNNALIRDEVTLRVDRCGSGYSFTSSHAANHFAAARYCLAFFAPVFGRWCSPTLFTWAALVAFAQVYVGLHFPLDIFCGALLGWSISTAVVFLIIRYLKKYADATLGSRPG